MATYNEVSKRYVQRIRVALERDGFSGTRRITNFEFRYSNTFTVLKEIRDDINDLVYEKSQKPLSNTDKQKIYEGISEELRLPSTTTLQRFVT